MSTSDTIFAVATGAARAAIAVVRLSGPHAHETVRALAGRLPKPRVASFARLREPVSGEVLDEALILVFEAARSELGEDGAELHLHGSPAVVAAVVRVLAAQPGLRQAEPGEFARRAFANGKLDLAQLEGLADLIDAETDWQRRQAQRQLSGAMRDAVGPWRDALLRAAAEVETAIDFAEDVALETSVHAAVSALIAPVRVGLRRELDEAPAAERIRDGVQIVIAGPPNAGKSTLLNALVRREAAIVSAIAGTTRDPIEVHLDLGGCPVTLVDTAGMREAADAIEQTGVRRAKERAESADLVLWLDETDGTPPAMTAPVWRIAPKADLGTEVGGASPPPCGEGQGWGSAGAPDPLRDRGAPPRSTAGPPPLTPPRKGEGSGEIKRTSAPSPAFGGPPPLSHGGECAPLSLSATTGENLDVLIVRLTAFAQSLALTGASGLLARARHRAAFAAAAAALDHLTGDTSLPIELIAEDLRAARFALDRLVGKVDVEDILGEIFSRFCIGK